MLTRILYTLGWFSLDSWLVIDSCMLLARETAKKTCDTYLYFDVLFFLAMLDCSESPIFPYDRRDRRLCVTGCHLATT